MLSTRPGLLERERERDEEEPPALEIIYKSKLIGLIPQWQVSDQTFPPLYYFDLTFFGFASVPSKAFLPTQCPG